MVDIRSFIQKLQITFDRKVFMDVKLLFCNKCVCVVKLN